MTKGILNTINCPSGMDVHIHMFAFIVFDTLEETNENTDDQPK